MRPPRKNEGGWKEGGDSILRRLAAAERMHFHAEVEGGGRPRGSQIKEDRSNDRSGEVFVDMQRLWHACR